MRRPRPEIRPVLWRGGTLYLLDQRRLPRRQVWQAVRTPAEAARAIRSMVVRGAPAIGVASAWAMALSLRGGGPSVEQALRRLAAAARRLRLARPTARNLFWAVERMEAAARAPVTRPATLRRRLEAEARSIQEEDEAACRSIGRWGARLIPRGARILTHCNAGALATAGYGTALGVIRRAHETGRRPRVWVDETRPLLQGSRLTLWELLRLGVDATLITDSMAAQLMGRGLVDLVIVGADRITANGDVANKVGTYGLALLARAHRVPFYVAAPCSTVDPALAHGRDIRIEERAEREVTEIAGVPIAPRGARALNPAFDVTPARLVTALITERGIVRPPFRKGLRTCRIPPR